MSKTARTRLPEEPGPKPEADSSAFLRALLSSFGTHLAVLDAEGTILITNPAWTSFAGPRGSLAARPADGENYFDSLREVAGADRARALALLAGAHRIVSGEETRLDFELPVEKEGSSFVFLARLSGFATAEGLRLAVTYRDITEIRSAERRLRESEERFKFAIEGTGDAIWDWDVPNAKITRSPQFAKMLGFPPGAGMEPKWGAFMERLHPDDFERVEKRCAELVRGPMDMSAIEQRVRHEDGTWRWIMTRCSVVSRDAAGRATRVIGVHTDITDLKEAEASLRQQRNENRLLALVAEHTTNAVVITGPDRCTLWVNRGFTSMTGYSLDDLRGKRPGVVLQGPETDPETLAMIEARLAAHESFRTRILYYRKDGRPFWMSLEVQPVPPPEGGALHYVAIMEDLTERERLEAELRLSQKLESVGQLASGIAHEINTPIQFVGDSITFLEEAWHDVGGLLRSVRKQARSTAVAEEDIDFFLENFPGAIARARDGVQRVASIVRAMKEFAHPDQGQFSPTDLRHVIDNALVVVRHEIKYVGTAEVDHGDVPPVQCRVGLISQVLLNLMVNAAHALADRKHTPETGRLLIKTRRADAHVVISVIDNGCGIPDAIRERIFDPFFTTKEVGRGSGQGLAIARAIIVEQHRGRIELDSKPGVGTTFELWLPIAGPGTQNTQSR